MSEETSEVKKIETAAKKAARPAKKAANTTKKATGATKASAPRKATVNKELDALARETMTSKWGTGRERDNALRVAGHDPGAVQAARARLRAEEAGAS